MILVRLGVPQQGAQGRCSHLLQSQPEGHFHGLQIGASGVRALSKMRLNQVCISRATS